MAASGKGIHQKSFNSERWDEPFPVKYMIPEAKMQRPAITNKNFLLSMIVGLVVKKYSLAFWSGENLYTKR